MCILVGGERGRQCFCLEPITQLNKRAPNPWVWSTGSYGQLCIPTQSLALNSEL